MIDFAIEKFGKLDVLVNNAGIMDNMAAVGDALDEKFDQLMAVNVYGPMVRRRKAVNVFLSQGNGGCIINMGSEGAQKTVPRGVLRFQKPRWRPCLKTRL